VTTSPPQTQDHQHEQVDRRWPAFAVCLVAGFMTVLDVSIVNVALPSIRTGISADSSDLQWVSSGYALSFGLVLVAAGRLGDIRGRKNMFVAGLVLFTVASAACGLAPSATLLVVARVIQGIGGGLIQPQVSGFIQNLFQGKERARAFGLFGATVGISTAVGPLVGGALIAAFGTEHGWRAVFFVNVPVGIIAVIAAMRLLPATAGKQQAKGLDPFGAVLLGAGVLCLLLPLVESQSWSGPLPWLLMIPGLALLGAFVAWERAQSRRGREPMVDLDLLRVPSYSMGAGVGLVYFAGFTSIFFVLALFLQEGHGYSALESGLAVTPFALGSAASAFLAGRLVSRIGRAVVAIGLAVMIVGLIATVVVVRIVVPQPLGGWEVPPADGVGFYTALPLLVAGLGSGAVISPNLTLTLSDVPVQQAGTAGGIVQTGQRIGGAAGIAAIGALFFSRLSATHGDWNASVADALLLSAGVTFLALVVAVVDLRRRHAQEG
jgi:EmrB/QacA subfamily drug resistance transporter